MALSRAEKALFAEAVVTAAAVRLSLAFTSVKRTERWLERLRTQTSADVRGAAPGLPGTIAIATRRAGKVVPDASCLTQALTGRSMLHRRGVASDLRIGVARATGKGLAAHAWLEVGGETIIGHHAGEYSLLTPGTLAVLSRK